MPVYGLKFRATGERVTEDFRDLAHAKSEAMRRAGDLSQLDRPDAAGWAARIYKGEVLVHEVAYTDLSRGEPEPRRAPPEVGDGLDEGVADSFPASDPPAAVNPVVGTREAAKD